MMNYSVGLVPGHSKGSSLKWHRHSCLCSDDRQPTTSTQHPRPHFTFNFNLGQCDANPANYPQNHCVESIAR